MKKWLVSEIIGPVARRIGGQFAAALVALGMAQQHEAAVAAAIAWGVVTVAEIFASAQNRRSIVAKTAQTLGFK